MLAYYPDRSSSLLVNFGSRAVTGTALRSGMLAATDASLRDRMDGACGGTVVTVGGGVVEVCMVGYASCRRPDGLVL